LGWWCLLRRWIEDCVGILSMEMGGGDQDGWARLWDECMACVTNERRLSINKTCMGTNGYSSCFTTRIMQQAIPSPSSIPALLPRGTVAKPIRGLNPQMLTSINAHTSILGFRQRISSNNNLQRKPRHARFISQVRHTRCLAHRIWASSFVFI